MSRYITNPKEDKKIIDDIKTVWMAGGSDTEACAYAGISKERFKDLLETNARLKNQKEAFQSMPAMRARLVVSKALDRGDVKTAKWYLEHKCSNEFNKKITTESEVASTVTVEDKEEMFKRLLENIE